MAKRTAVIDIGSNSVRMVIFEKTSRFAFHLLFETKSRVRISESAYENDGNLQTPAMDRASGALRDFLSIAEAYKARKVLCCATSAVRDAPNRQLFLKRIKRETGLSIKVIDGEKEAYLGGIAAANLLPPLEGITIDIGGGSTEIAQVNARSVGSTHSLDLGTVRLKELFFDRNDMEGAVNYIDTALQSLPLTEAKTVIGIGGTFRALAQALLQKQKHPLKKLHGYTFDADLLKSYCESILSADEKTLKKLGIKKERYDVIKPGALILLRLLLKLKPENLVTSGVGVREGFFLYDLLRHARHAFPSNFNPSVRYLLDSYGIESHTADLFGKTAKKLFDLLHSHLGLEPGLRPELAIAAKLAKIGTALHFYSYRQHSYYLSQTALEYGFTHRQIMLISTLLRYQKRKSPTKAFMNKYASLLPDLQTIDSLTLLIAITDALLAHHPRSADFSLAFENGVLTVKTALAHLYLAKEQIAVLELPQGLSIRFESLS